MKFHWLKVFLETLFFYWDWDNKLWWKGVLLRHSFLMTIFGHLPIRFYGIKYTVIEKYQDEDTGEWKEIKRMKFFPDIIWT